MGGGCWAVFPHHIYVIVRGGVVFTGPGIMMQPWKFHLTSLPHLCVLAVQLSNTAACFFFVGLIHFTVLIVHNKKYQIHSINMGLLFACKAQESRYMCVHTEIGLKTLFPLCEQLNVCVKNKFTEFIFSIKIKFKLFFFALNGILACVYILWNFRQYLLTDIEGERDCWIENRATTKFM
jgi:hypothetical protein